MPFQSEAQRRLMWALHPDIARRWAHEKGAKNKGLPMHKKRKKVKKKTKKHKKRSIRKTIRRVIRKRGRRK